jgi:hypothetical protein
MALFSVFLPLLLVAAPAQAVVRKVERTVVTQSADAMRLDRVAGARYAMDAFLLNAGGFKNETSAVPWMHKLTTHLAAHGFNSFEGNTGNAGASVQAYIYAEWAAHRGFKTICETGFNAGHSALRFLALSTAHVYEFDLGFHEYGKVSADFLQRNFPGRFTVTWGDSTESLPSFKQQHPDVTCDLVIVDGGHDYRVAMADLKNFMSMASEKHLLAMDDTPGTGCDDCTKAWNELVGKGCIKELQKVPMGANRGFSIGQFSECQL